MRQLRRGGTVLENLLRRRRARPPLTARMSAASIHFGQPASSTSSPLENAEAGYLNRNSNMIIQRPNPKFPWREKYRHPRWEFRHLRIVGRKNLSKFVTFEN